MPRNGSGIYEQPFDDVETNTTIASTVYNGFTRDVEQDLNDQRPIIAGGTGADNAEEALVNIGGETATQLVTNYDAHLWYPGSFRSAAGATGAPTANAFSGVCYLGEALAYPPTNANVVVEARDVTTGLLYVKRKVAGVWTDAGAWGSDDDRFVNVSGDTMVGDLTISKANPQFNIVKAAGTEEAAIYGWLGATRRWKVILGDTTAEGGGNTGSNFSINSRDDAGAHMATSLLINRATGTATFGGGIVVNGDAGVTGGFQAASVVGYSVVRSFTGLETRSWAGDTAQGLIHFGSLGTSYIHFSGGVFNFTHPVSTTGLTVGGTSTFSGAATFNNSATYEGVGQFVVKSASPMNTGTSAPFEVQGIGNPAIGFHYPAAFATSFGMASNGNFYMGGRSHSTSTYQFYTTRDGPLLRIETFEELYQRVHAVEQRLQAGIAAVADVVVAVRNAMTAIPDTFTATNFAAVKIQLDALTEAVAAMVEAQAAPVVTPMPSMPVPPMPPPMPAGPP